MYNMIPTANAQIIVKRFNEHVQNISAKKLHRLIYEN